MVGHLVRAVEIREPVDHHENVRETPPRDSCLGNRREAPLTEHPLAFRHDPVQVGKEAVDPLSLVGVDHATTVRQLRHHAERTGREIENVHRKFGHREPLCGLTCECPEKCRLAGTTRAENDQVAVAQRVVRPSALRLLLGQVDRTESERGVNAPRGGKVSAQHPFGQRIQPRHGRDGQRHLVIRTDDRRHKSLEIGRTLLLPPGCRARDPPGRRHRLVETEHDNLGGARTLGVPAGIRVRGLHRTDIGRPSLHERPTGQ